MNQKQKVFNLLAKTGKTQLSKGRKMNFALADDLNAVLDEAMDALRMTSIQLEAAYEMVTEVIGQIPDPDSFYQDIEGAQTRLQMIVGRAQAASDELGVDPQDIRGYAEALDTLEDLKELDGQIADYGDAISPILGAAGLR